MKTFFVTIAALWLVLGACSPDGGIKEKISGDSVAVEVNAKAPAFATRSLSGETVRLSDYVGTHVVLLEFWSIFCKSCIQEMPHVEDLYRRFGDRGFVVLSVNTDVFSVKKIKKFLARAGIAPPYPIVRDPRQEVAGAYGVELLPVTVIVDKQGWIRLYQEGYRPGDENRFASKVRHLLGETSTDDVTLAPRKGVTAFAPKGIEQVAVGDKVATLTARDMVGNAVRLDPDRPRLFFFWSLFCQPCRAEFPALAGLARRFRPLGIDVRAVNVDSIRMLPRVKRFVADHGDIRSLLDGGGPRAGVAQALGVRATPAVVLIDGSGTVIHTASGTSDLPALSARLERLAATR